MDITPVVVENAKSSVLEVEGQVWVVVLEAAKLHTRRRLYDWLSGAAQEHIHLFTVPCAKLLTSHHALDVFTVSEKHTAFDGSQKNTAIDTVINGDSGCMVKHIDVAVFTLLDDKLLPVQFARKTTCSNIFEPCQHVVLGVNLYREIGD